MITRKIKQKEISTRVKKIIHKVHTENYMKEGKQKISLKLFHTY